MIVSFDIDVMWLLVGLGIGFVLGWIAYKRLFFFIEQRAMQIAQQALTQAGMEVNGQPADGKGDIYG